MKRELTPFLLLAFAELAAAAGPSWALPSARVDWVGGGWYTSDQTKPGWGIDSTMAMGEFPSTTLFFQPRITFRDQKPGTNLGIGSRTPLFSDRYLGGLNAWYDYTGDNGRQRLGLGAELYGPYASGFVNVYAPVLSAWDNNQKATPGFDVNLKIPIPKFEVKFHELKFKVSCIAFWPGFFFYQGYHGRQLYGWSLLFKAVPLGGVEFVRGFRAAAPSSGRDKMEVTMGLLGKVPVKDPSLKKFFKYNVLPYPEDVSLDVTERVSREGFISYEEWRR